MSITKGTCLYNQGDKTDKFYGIISGKVSFKKTKKFFEIKEIPQNEDNKAVEYSTPKYKYTEEIVANLDNGKFFGYMEIIQKVPRTTTAVANTDVELMVLRQSDFIKTFYKDIIKSDANKRDFFMSKNTFIFRT